jgi:hypothetical protein
MPVESAADRLTFLSVADFGCVFTYTSIAGGGPVTGLVGIFDNDFLQTDSGGAETGVYTSSPRLTCRSADLATGGLQDDLVTITSAPSQPELVGRVYRCTVPHADGTGMTVLWLEKA